MARLFGTDGIRGKVNSELTNEIAYRLGQAAVKFQGNRVLIARDTRISGQMLEAALAAGVMSAGGHAFLCGVIPTPAVAMLVRKHNMDAGVMISASHNPPEYNGLKMFDGKGYKLPDAVEDEIDAFIKAGGLETTKELTEGDETGIVSSLDTAVSDYIDFVTDSVKSQKVDFSGMKIAVDSGHGASFRTTPETLRELGADVVAINTDYSGKDINVKCGSTHLEPLFNLVKETGADIGIAHDGDADRVMMVSADGHEIDGDVMLSVIAKDLKARNLLRGDVVVGTVMSNLGLKQALAEDGISLVQTKVGDRYVLEEMLDKDYAIGGEQSGHVILIDHNTTGDGLMTAVQFLCAVKRSGKTPSEAIAHFNRFPQVLINVHVDDKEAAMSSEGALTLVREAEEDMGDNGRVLLRPSGTEPVVRVMVEANDQVVAERWANAIANKLSQENNATRENQKCRNYCAR